MGSRELKAHCALTEPAMELLKFAMSDLNLSARAYDRVLKVARTIADLAGAEDIAGEHVSEAIQYRFAGPQLWAERVIVVVQRKRCEPGRLQRIFKPNL